MTILRDQETERGDFIFYADRLSTLIVEKALTLLPYEAQTVTTPLGIEFEGKARASQVGPLSAPVDKLTIAFGGRVHPSIRWTILAWSEKSDPGCTDWSYAYSI